MTETLAEAVRVALSAADLDQLAEACTARPNGVRDRYLTLLEIYRLDLSPIDELSPATRLSGHPAVSALKWRLEEEWLAELDSVPIPSDLPCDDVTTALRVLAARDRIPPVYKWVAGQATWSELVRFLTLEGGPDTGFDDLVAICQVGLDGEAKLELAGNYWEEMGRGQSREVHSRLYREFAGSIGMRPIAAQEHSVAALARASLGGLLATNRWLQPEMLGALGMIELQAGPRCRMVLRGLDRCGAPPRAFPFYQVHAEVDPRHGRDWLARAIEPLARSRPELGWRMLRGAWWRAHTNAAFFAELSAETARAA